jgi:hemolysin D
MVSTRKARSDCQRSDELQFLPAAMEIEQSAPPLYGRLILWAIVSLVLLALLWACMGRIDIVAIAPGKIIPIGKAKQIQAFEHGVVQAIHVREGEAVRRGDPLLSFDATLSAADVQRASEDLHEARLQWLGEVAFNRFLQQPDSTGEASQLITESLQQLGLHEQDYDRLFLAARLSARCLNYQSRLSALHSQLEALAAEKLSAEALLKSVQRTLPIVRERTQSLAKLYRKQLASRDQYLVLEKQHIELEQQLAQHSATVSALGARASQVRANLGALQQQELAQNLQALTTARHQSYSLEQAVTKAQELQQRQVLRAPMDGIVQQLQVHTIGGIVTPAQALMSLIPADGKLEVEAFFNNRDVGFVSAGQAGAIKIDAFTFTRYGTIDGTLHTLSSDAVNVDGLGLVYPAIIGIAANSIAVAGKQVPLAAGMSVSVEIKTGSRRIIEFFLSPLLKMGKESIRER